MNTRLDEVQLGASQQIIYGKNLNDSTDEMLNESYDAKVNEMKADLVEEIGLLNQYDDRSVL